MSNPSYQQKTARTGAGFAPRPAQLRSALIGAPDRRHVTRLLRSGDVGAQSMVAHVLRRKIAAARACNGLLPGNVVTGRSSVTYAVDGGPARTVLLTHEAQGGADDIVAVASLLGATLIGMRAGERAPLLREDGTIASLTVLAVARPA